MEHESQISDLKCLISSRGANYFDRGSDVYVSGSHFGLPPKGDIKKTKKHHGYVSK